MNDVDTTVPSSLPAAPPPPPEDSAGDIETAVPSVNGRSSSSPHPRPAPPRSPSQAVSPSSPAAGGEDHPLKEVVNNNKADDLIVEQQPPQQQQQQQPPTSPKAESEADTIIQSGRESSSPEKKRKFTAQNDGQSAANEGNAVDSNSSLAVKRRKSATPGRGANRSASPVKSPPPYPPSRHDTNAHGKSAAKSPRNGDDKAEEQEEEEAAENIHHRSPSPGRVPSSAKPRVAKISRSISPDTQQRQQHKRTTSGPSTQRKKHPVLPGLQRQSSEDRQSVSSSASGSHGSPLPSARLRRLATADSAAPSKHHQQNTGHKKQRDQNGRTRLARACAVQELETAIARHAENPEDLNVPDNAGNTPLQIAALEGCADIVEFLIGEGCEINTKNIDRDTPLIDAVENGHLEVVKLLLDAGANPRVVNAEGDEPYELVPLDTEDYDEIRRVIREARSHPKSKRRSEDPYSAQHREASSRRTSDNNSPRETPPPYGGLRSPPPHTTTKRKTVRSEATRNDLLWTKATPENLREFAARGDIAGVANILNVGQRADPESSIAAAKGGHDEVLSLLLGMGDADADPEPARGNIQKSGYNTPMLAAIGRGNLEVIKLLLSQPGFNPTRRLYHGRTYYELSRDRKGEDWELEHDLLKDAYENYVKSKKSRAAKVEAGDSPVRRSRDIKDKVAATSSTKRTVVPKEPPPPLPGSQPPHPPRKVSDASHRHDAVLSKDAAGLKLKRRREGGILHPSSSSSKDRPVLVRSHSSVSSAKDVGPETSRLESSPRRKIRDGDGKVRDGEVRTTTTVVPRSEDHHVIKKKRLGVGIARPLQGNSERRKSGLLPSDSVPGKDEGASSKSTAADHTGEVSGSSKAQRKRSRDSVSPERVRDRPDRDHERDIQVQKLHKKKRRVVHQPRVDGNVGSMENGNTDDLFDEEPPKRDHHRPHNKERIANKRSPQPPSSEKKESNNHGREQTPVKEECEKRDENGGGVGDLGQILPEDDPVKKAEIEAEKQRKRQEAERIAAEEAKEKEEARRKADEERVAAEEAAEREKREETAEKMARYAQEKAEEAERKKKEAEQRRVKQAEDERQKRLDQERMRFERQRREHEEHEQRRRNALPDRLRIAANLVGANDPRARSHAWLKKFLPLVTAQTRQLDPTFRNAELVENEKWVPNYLVAPLLATNDLQLRQCKYFGPTMHLICFPWN